MFPVNVIFPIISLILRADEKIRSSKCVFLKFYDSIDTFHRQTCRGLSNLLIVTCSAFQMVVPGVPCCLAQTAYSLNFPRARSFRRVFPPRSHFVFRNNENCEISATKTNPKRFQYQYSTFGHTLQITSYKAS